MLLEFRFRNNKSFCGETNFSLAAVPEQRGLDYSLIDTGNGIQVLCSSVIYGPNAAGKSSVVSAMDTFRSIVLRGNIHNSEDTGSPNYEASDLSLMHNWFLSLITRFTSIPICYAGTRLNL